MKRLFVLAISLVFLMALVLSASAAQQTKLASQDKKFMTEAAIGGMFEVEAGKLAAKQGGSEEVKQFGERMATDHTKVNDELMQLANKKGAVPPKELDSSHKSKLDKLRKLSGADFDKQYIDDMVKDHKKDVSAFKKEAQNGKDAELKSFASRTVPTLQEHLKMAEDIQAKMKAGGVQQTGSKQTGGGTAGTAGTR